MAATYPNTTHASEHFTWKELACKCGRCTLSPQTRVNLARLAASLEQLRALVGGPLFVNCAFRCPPHNAEVGGVADSQHLRGTAADVTTKRLTPAQLAALAGKVPAFASGGIGVYPGFVHVDVRGHMARW